MKFRYIVFSSLASIILFSTTIGCNSIDTRVKDRSVKYHLVRQESNVDCGAAVMASVASYYGKKVSLDRAREIVNTSVDGTSLLDLKKGAETLGFTTRMVRAKDPLKVLENLDLITLPAIIHWEGNHWVVLYKQKDDRFIIGDPAIGIRYVTRQELITAWQTRVMLLLTIK